jgi:pimeloyl-[acyl-carrier protein] methyl ester esterase
LVDLPGHGLSPREVPLTIDSLASAVGGILPPRCLLGGWSLGGMVALHLAAQQPAGLRGLVLIGSTPRFAAADDWPHGTAEEALASFAAELDADAPTLLARFRASMCRSDIEERKLRRLMSALPAPPADLTALREGLAILRHADLREEARRVAAPALVIHGARDAVVPPGAGAWLAAQIGGARWQMFDDCTHLPFLSHPEDCAALVRQFAGEIESFN